MATTSFIKLLAMTMAMVLLFPPEAAAAERDDEATFDQDRNEVIVPAGLDPPTHFRTNPRSRPPTHDRFAQWMRVITEFFTRGNWLSGGPHNLLEYISNTLTKLLAILMNGRGGGGGDPVDIPSLEPNDYDTDTGNDLYRSGRQQRQPTAAANNNAKRLNLGDLIRMVPMDALRNFN